jgi:hypothetical protein
MDLYTAFYANGRTCISKLCLDWKCAGDAAQNAYPYLNNLE